MDSAKEAYYLQFAADNPEILCSEVPSDLLEEAATEAEPTPFFEQFFGVGYSGWLAKKHGRRIRFPQDRINAAILVLWYRAVLLNTDRILGTNEVDVERPFFSDEGLH